MKKEKLHRGNYEEYFLLYVDNELSDQEKQWVEDFVAANPDLKVELDILFDSVLHEEKIPFKGKDALLKNELSAVEELQLSFLDNELDSTEINRLNKIHQADPNALAFFDLLKKTKLPEEKILFPYKEKLYRRTTRVGLMRWLTPVAAAAVLITIFLLRDNPLTIKAEAPEIIMANNPTVTYQEPQHIVEKQLLNLEKEIHIKKRIKLSTVSISQSKPSMVEQPKVILDENILEEVNGIPEIISTPVIETTTAEKNITEKALTIKSEYTQEALINTIAEEEIEQPKKGFRGIIRKASRIYNKITHPEGDKPLIKFTRYEIELK